MQRTAALLAGVALALSASSAILAAPPDVQGILRQWSAASASVAAPGKSARQRASHKYRGQFSGHQIALILEFRGSVAAEELLNRYRFTKAKQVGKTIRLTASPKDNVERLFFSRFELTLDAMTHLPVSISFWDRSDRPLGAAVTLFTEQQRQRITLVADEPIEAPVPTEVNLAKGEPLQLSQILTEWSARSSKLRNLEMEFTRFSYDHVFNIEKRAVGSIFYEQPNKGRLEFRPGKVVPRETSRVTNKVGKPYDLQSDTIVLQTWIWNGKENFVILPDDKQVFAYEIGSEKQTIRQTNLETVFTPLMTAPQEVLPLVLGIDRRNLIEDYKWEILKQTKFEFRLKATPQTNRLKSSFSEIWVLLDSSTFQTRAIKYVAPDGQSEQVYSFQKLRRNSAGNDYQKRRAQLLSPPNLKGYRKIRLGK